MSRITISPENKVCLAISDGPQGMTKFFPLLFTAPVSTYICKCNEDSTTITCFKFISQSLK